jgi:hypothetical protein
MGNRIMEKMETMEKNEKKEHWRVIEDTEKNGKGQY